MSVPVHVILIPVRCVLVAVCSTCSTGMSGHLAHVVSDTRSVGSSEKWSGGIFDQVDVCIGSAACGATTTNFDVFEHLRSKNSVIYLN